MVSAGVPKVVLPLIHTVRPLRKHASVINSIFTGVKNDNFQLKMFDFFLLFAENIGLYFLYMLEPPNCSNDNP